jgi:hypothetical protein
MSSPTKINSGNSRPVTDINVLNAENRGVEREQLNRILNELNSRIEAASAAASSSSSSGSSISFNITTDSTMTAIQSGNSVALGVAASGITATQLANSAVTTAKLVDANVTDAKFRQSAGLSVVGRSANSTGNVADITAGTDGHVLRRSGTALGFGTIPNTSVTGLGTMATQNASAVAITGGTINGASVGASTPSTGAFTTLTTTGNVALGDSTADVHTVNGQMTVNAPNGIRATNGGSVVLEMLGRDDLGFCIIGSDTDHDVVFRRNNAETARLTSTGASITGTLSTSNTIRVDAANNHLVLYETDASAGNRYWTWQVNGETLQIQSRSDVGAFIANLFQITRAGAVSVNGTLTATGTITAEKSLLVDDVYQITDVTTAGQTRTVDLANGATQTISINQACTLNATGPAGKAGHLMLVIYNSAGSSSACSFGTGWYPTSGALLPNGTNTQVTHLWWDGTRMAPLFDSNFPGDLRPT